MDMMTRVQILNEAVCISHDANTLGKVWNSTIVNLAINKLYEKLHSLILAIEYVKKKENI